jgi:transposase-like protein
VVLDFLEQRMGLRELARKHSLSRNLLSQWVRKYETGQLTDETVDAVRIAEYEGKIAELERKVGQLTMEVDLLKKGRLARQPNGDSFRGLPERNRWNPNWRSSSAAAVNWTVLYEALVPQFEGQRGVHGGRHCWGGRTLTSPFPRGTSSRPATSRPDALPQ